MNQIWNSDKELEMRLFYVLAWTGVIANTVGTIANGIFYGFNQETMFNLICTVLVCMAAAFGMASKKPRISIAVILIVCCLVEFPVMYIIYGADRLGYMFLGLVGVVLFLGEKWRVTGAGIMIVYDSAIIIWRESHRGQLYMVPGGDSTVASLMDYVISAISIAVMIVILLIQYEAQQKKLKEMAEELQEMAHKDPLTGLYNRRYLTDYIDRKIKNGDNEFAVALIDIDDFKKINDNYGHLYGDETLQALADCMKKEIAGNGIAARYGGEEFMLVFDQADKKEIEKALSNVKQRFDFFGMDTKKQHMSFSGGVETFRQEDRITKLFNAADEKLYSAKHMGKNRIVYDSQQPESL